MRKAYDSIDWTFFEAILLDLGFPIRYVNMTCVTPITHSIMVNGSPSRRFKASRGLKQGDPLIFLLGA